MYGKTGLIVTTLFGVLVFLSKILMPPPINDMLVVVQASLLALSSLIGGRFGATYASLINGILVTMWTPSFAPFGLVFSLVYGLTTDGFLYVFKVREGGQVRPVMSIAALAISATLTGLSSMYVTTLLGLAPMVPILYLVIMLAGILNGASAGYLTSILWNKYLLSYSKKIQPSLS